MDIKDVFVYHLDNELQKLFALNRYNCNYLYMAFKSITRVAFLVCEHSLLIPASNYFESDISFKILNELKELNEIGAISLISSSHNIDELLRRKTDQHGDNVLLSKYHYRDFLDDETRIILPGTLKMRERSASLDIKKNWYISINDLELKKALFGLSSDIVPASKFEDALYEVPYKLGNRAYISDYILPLLPIDREKARNADYFLNAFITREYINSFLNEFNATCLQDIPIIDSNVILPHRATDEIPYISYAKIVNELKILRRKNVDAFTFIGNCSAYELIEFKNSSDWKCVLDKIVYPKSIQSIIHIGQNILLRGDSVKDTRNRGKPKKGTKKQPRKAEHFQGE